MSNAEEPIPPYDDTEWAVIEQRHYARDTPADLTTVVIETVAAAKEVEPTSIEAPQLYEIVDTAAIEAGLFGPTVTDQHRDTAGRVDFKYLGFRVTVRSDGWVQVAEPVER